MTGLLTYAAVAGALAASNAQKQADEQPPQALVEQSIQKERPHFIKVNGGWHAMTDREFNLYQQEQEEIYKKHLEQDIKQRKILFPIMITITSIILALAFWAVYYSLT